MRTAARATFVGSIALVVALTASAQAEQGTIWVFGTGTKSCGHFVQVADSEHKAKPRHTAPEAISTLGYVAFVTWTEGFLSGTNFSEHAMVGASISDHFADAMAWIENYCRQHPLDSYLNAVMQLKVALAAKEPIGTPASPARN